MTNGEVRQERRDSRCQPAQFPAQPFGSAVTSSVPAREFVSNWWSPWDSNSGRVAVARETYPRKHLIAVVYGNVASVVV